MKRRTARTQASSSHHSPLRSSARRAHGVRGGTGRVRLQVPAPSGRGDHGSDEGDRKAAANMRGLAKDPSYNFAMTSSYAALGFVWPVLFKQLVCTRAGHFRLP